MRGRDLEAGHLRVDFRIWMSRERLERVDSLFLLVMRDADGQHLGPSRLLWERRAARFVGVAV